MRDLVETYVERYRSLDLGGTPSSISQIAEFEQKLGRQLPAVYVAFLLVAGRERPARWIGSDCTIGWLRDLQGGADELLQECGQQGFASQNAESGVKP
jgi:hypothetical protein